jgi:3-carboxy-cis,cis-muconate cycloisomerase
LPSDRLFGPIFGTEAMLEVVSDTAWVQTMLDVEAAAARAEARAGVIPAGAAEAIAACCDAARFDVAQIGREAAASLSPVIPLVRALTAAAPEDAARYVHWGLTSQDVVDTAMMLIAARGLDLLVQDLDGVADACAELADRHRSAVMPGRTLLQQALPVTFGLKAAGWLIAALEARDHLATLRRERLAVQCGGAVGTLAALAPQGLAVVRELSAELGLAEPVIPWHTSRRRVAELGTALGLTAGAMGKIALDVALMTQSEVGEVAEPDSSGSAGSSTMPQKRNPVRAVTVNACVRGVHAQVSVLLGAMLQEHERAAGGWQAEWEALGEALRLTSGAVARTRELLENLEVYEERMRVNVGLTWGMLLSEAVMMALAKRTGRLQALELVRAAAQRADRSGRELREELLADLTIQSRLRPEEVDAALDPNSYLGAASELVDRALAVHRARRRT